MVDEEMSTSFGSGGADPTADPKGKGKAVEPTHQEMSMDEDDDDSGEEEEGEGVSPPQCTLVYRSKPLTPCDQEPEGEKMLASTDDPWP